MGESYRTEDQKYRWWKGKVPVSLVHRSTREAKPVKDPKARPRPDYKPDTPQPPKTQPRMPQPPQPPGSKKRLRPKQP